MTIDQFQMTGQHYTSLNEHHQMGPARYINRTDLVNHLVSDHGVALGKAHTKGELGKLHALVHAILAHPALGELMGLPEGYGTGKQIKAKH